MFKDKGLKVEVKVKGLNLNRQGLKNITNICLYHPKKSVVAENSINLGHQIQNTIILVKKTRLILREATETELHRNMKRKESFSLSLAWKPLICDFKE
jgi:hypothetical protein